MKAMGWVVLGASVLTTGCRFERHHGTADSKDGDVKIATPFGGISVKSDEKSAQAAVGLTPYPGASLTQRDSDGKNDNAANVSLNFGNFHLGVKALSYQTADAPDKVLAFYRKDMARYGAVILCSGSKAVGQPERTQEGLTCDSDNGNSKTITIQARDKSSLKAGSKQHQHIVSVEPRDGGTKIGLVALDLPGNLDGDGSSD